MSQSYNTPRKLCHSNFFFFPSKYVLYQVRLNSYRKISRKDAKSLRSSQIFIISNHPNLILA